MQKIVFVLFNITRTKIEGMQKDLKMVGLIIKLFYSSLTGYLSLKDKEAGKWIQGKQDSSDL